MTHAVHRVHHRLLLLRIQSKHLPHTREHFSHPNRSSVSYQDYHLGEKFHDRLLVQAGRIRSLGRDDIYGWPGFPEHLGGDQFHSPDRKEGQDSDDEEIIPVNNRL